MTIDTNKFRSNISCNIKLLPRLTLTFYRARVNYKCCTHKWLCWAGLDRVVSPTSNHIVFQLKSVITISRKQLSPWCKSFTITRALETLTLSKSNKYVSITPFGLAITPLIVLKKVSKRKIDCNGRGKIILNS